MQARRIGVLHPGEMGRVVAASLLNSGSEVRWASEGRGEQTRDRAVSLGLKDAGSLSKLGETCDTIFSVCPPEFADDVADAVLQTSFRGLYVDANAISPERVRQMDRRMRDRGVTFVDGGILGVASMTPGRTWMYLSGDAASEAASCFTEGPMLSEVMSGPVGQASSLKMCFAAYSKGFTALLAAVLAAAEELGVRDAIEQQWTRMPGSPTDAAKRITQSAPKAWRFVPEMQEIASTFESVGITPSFHEAAAEVYSQMARFRNSAPGLEEVLQALHPALALDTK